MDNLNEIIGRLPDLLVLKPAAPEDIANIETELALRLSDEYKAYLLRFGAVLANDVELTGVAKSKNRNVIHATKREWDMNPSISHDLYVVENLGIEGIVIWQDASGSIYESRPNDSARRIAGSLAEYLEM